LEGFRLTNRSMQQARLLPLLLGAFAAVMAPIPAHAHLVNTGLGPVYDGISHVLLSPEDLIPLLAMALLAGLNGTAAARQSLFGLTGAWFAGALAGQLAGQDVPVSALAGAASFLALGTMTAADPRLSPAVVTLIAAIIGLMHGWLNGPGLAQSGHAALVLAGIVSAVFAIEAIAAATVISIQATPARIALRVAGSWIAAIGLLMLGWGLRTA